MVKHRIEVAEKVGSDNFLQKKVNVMAPSPQIHDIHTYIHDILFFGKKSDVAVRVVEADFGCEVDLKTKVSRKIKVDCQD